MQKELAVYKSEMLQELENILAYWMQYTVDEVNNGFTGRLDNDNVSDPQAPKGSVLNSRILWSFSAAFNLTRKSEYLHFAERAFKYISAHFIDKKYGGVYWTVDYLGRPLDTKNQIYALAFAVYGLSEYYLASDDEEAKSAALGIYMKMVEYSYDNKFGGYIEALTMDWKELPDSRLSSKDHNEKKSMNTHLHVLEAFTNLYRIWPEEMLKQRIIELIIIFMDHIIDPDTQHLRLFFNEQWQSRSAIISYGHDIEAAWLIQEAAEIIQEEAMLQAIKRSSIKMAEASISGLDSDGGLWYEYDLESHQLIKEKHWWPQAEAMVGFFNAWQLTGDEKHLRTSMNCWGFVKSFIRNNEKGEWYWGVNENYSVMNGEDKVGLWKCPYHNSRACMELIKRLE